MDRVVYEVYEHMYDGGTFATFEKEADADAAREFLQRQGHDQAAVREITVFSSFEVCLLWLAGVDVETNEALSVEAYINPDSTSPYMVDGKSGPEESKDPNWIYNNKIVAMAWGKTKSEAIDNAKSHREAMLKT